MRKDIKSTDGRPFTVKGTLPIPGEKLANRPRSVVLQESVDRVIANLPTEQRSGFLRDAITKACIESGWLQLDSTNN
jgi:hypothetical protein